VRFAEAGSAGEKRVWAWLATGLGTSELPTQTQDFLPVSDEIVKSWDGTGQDYSPRIRELLLGTDAARLPVPSGGPSGTEKNL